MPIIPSTYNMLSNIDLLLTSPRLPQTSFWVQECNLPTVTLASTRQDTMLQPIPVHGGPMIYDPLRVEFLLDENLDNFREAHDWLTSIGEPDSLSQYQTFASTMDDVILTILDSNKKPNLEFRFEGATPVALSIPSLMTTKATTVEYMTGVIVFDYRKYFITKLP